MIIECTAYFKYLADNIADNNLQVSVFINFKLLGKKCILSLCKDITTHIYTYFNNIFITNNYTYFKVIWKSPLTLSFRPVKRN